MKITIDTEKDSPESIQKAIQLLSSLSNSVVHTNNDMFGNSPVQSSSNDSMNPSSDLNTLPSSNTNENPTPPSSSQGGVFNMFSNNQPPEEEEQVSEEKVQLLQY